MGVGVVGVLLIVAILVGISILIYILLCHSHKSSAYELEQFSGDLYSDVSKALIHTTLPSIDAATYTLEDNCNVYFTSSESMAKACDEGSFDSNPLAYKLMIKNSTDPKQIEQWQAMTIKRRNPKLISPIRGTTNG